MIDPMNPHLLLFFILHTCDGSFKPFAENVSRFCNLYASMATLVKRQYASP